MRLKWKRWLIVLVAAVLIVGTVVLWLHRRFSPRIGPIVDGRDASNQTFKIHVDEHLEENAFLPGTYYIFRSAPLGSNAWHDIMTFYYDDTPDIDRAQIRFINDRLAFIFIGWTFAVTTDAGATWSVWNAGTDLPNWECCNYRLITDVTLNSDGTGTMTLNPIQNRRGEVPQLRTRDFGRHWSV